MENLHWDTKWGVSCCHIGKIAYVQVYYADKAYKAEIKTGVATYTLKKPFTDDASARAAAVVFVKKLLMDATNLLSEDGNVKTQATQ